MFGISELAILIIVGVLLFGAKKLPELARSAGKSARILKSEAKAMKTEGKPDGTPSSSYTVHPAPDPAPPPAPPAHGATEPRGEAGGGARDQP